MRHLNPASVSNDFSAIKMWVPLFSNLGVMKGTDQFFHLDIRIKEILSFEQWNFGKVWSSEVIHVKLDVLLVNLLLESLNITEFIEIFHELISIEIDGLFLLLNKLRLVFKLMDDVIESFWVLNLLNLERLYFKD